MTLNVFIQKTDIKSLAEIEKVELISFYMLKMERISEFEISSVCERLSSCGFGEPNKSRLRKKILKSRNFVKGKADGLFKLHISTVEKLDQLFPFLSVMSDHVETVNSIIPEDLYNNTKGYIRKLAIQINACYENGISDGCAILMRRLLEVLLILGYRAKERENEIIESGTNVHKKLTTIIDYTLTNRVLAIQKDTADVLHDFRVLGNFSAHGITYNCRKEELTKITRKYRFAIEDLLYAAELKN